MLPHSLLVNIYLLPYHTSIPSSCYKGKENRYKIYEKLLQNERKLLQTQ